MLWQLFQTITPQICLHLLIKKYTHTRKDISIINHPSNINNGIYLFFNTVHLLKNTHNNLFNSRRFIFP